MLEADYELIHELSEEYAKWKVFRRISGSKKPCGS
jgi:hypothetical protein